MYALIVFVSNDAICFNIGLYSYKPHSNSFSIRPGQEEGNVPFVEEAGFGTYSGNPSNIAETVATWLSSEERLTSMQEAALAAARPSATIDIAKDLAQMLFDHKSASATKAEERELVLQ